MIDAEGWPAATARGSLLARAVNSHLPEPPPQIQELERQLVGGDYPQLFQDLQEAPDIPAAPTGSPVSQEVLDSVAPSAVRLQSEACGQIQSGSGFFVGAGLIATNAHVVAGAGEIELSSADGGRGNGDVVAFDPSVDLALVRTDMDRPALRLAPPEVGDQGLVLGFPGGGPFTPSPFEVGELIQARGYDIYDSSTVDREVVALAAAHGLPAEDVASIGDLHRQLEAGGQERTRVLRIGTDRAANVRVHDELHRAVATALG
jgi:hypothetical protein